MNRVSVAIPVEPSENNVVYCEANIIRDRINKRKYDLVNLLYISPVILICILLYYIYKYED